MADERSGGGSSSFDSVSVRERITSIDTVRGFALLGILVVNMLFFAYPLNTALTPPYEGLIGSNHQFADWVAWWFVNLFFQLSLIHI